MQPNTDTARARFTRGGPINFTSECCSSWSLSFFFGSDFCFEVMLRWNRARGSSQLRASHQVIVFWSMRSRNSLWRVQYSYFRFLLNKFLKYLGDWPVIDHI
jgi:hypothetical protein